MERRTDGEFKSGVQTFRQSCYLARLIWDQSNPEYHTHTYICLHFAPDALSVSVCVAVALVPARQQPDLARGESVPHQRHLCRPLFLRTELLPEQKQMWASSPLFLRLGPASSPPQIRKTGISAETDGAAPPAPLPAATSPPSAVKSGETRCVLWLLCPSHRLVTGREKNSDDRRLEQTKRSGAAWTCCMKAHYFLKWNCFLFSLKCILAVTEISGVKFGLHNIIILSTK